MPISGRYRDEAADATASRSGRLRSAENSGPLPRDASAADAAALSAREFRRILIIKLSAVGDVIHTIPVLNKLRRRYPSARIDWLLRPQIAELIRHHPAVSNVLLFAREELARPWRGLAGLARLLAQLRAARYDLVIDMHGQFRTALLTLASGAPVRIGFDRPRPEVWAASERRLPAEAFRHCWKGAREGSWIAYSDPIHIDTLEMHAVDRYLRVGPMLGLDEGPADFSFVIPPAAAAQVDLLLREHRLDDRTRRPGLLVIAPGTIWETKHWKRERFAAVARHFLADGWGVMLVGAPRDRRVCDAVAAAAPGTVSLAGQTTLAELAALVQRSAACLTNDSGPMHLAVALDRPVVSIFGPSDALWIGPYGRADAVLSADLPCSPCYLRKLSRCPHDHACMREVSSDSVIERIERVLATASRAPAPQGPAAR